MAELSNPIIKQAVAFDIYAWLAQSLPRIEDKVESGLTLENRAKAQMASLAQQQLQIADQLATARESAGRQETGQGSQQDVLASATTAAANWLVFDDPAPPAATVVPIRYSWRTPDWMFGDAGGQPIAGTVH
jgi:type II secretory pathway pseudopilin PulG